MTVVGNVIQVLLMKLSKEELHEDVENELVKEVMFKNFVNMSRKQ